MKLVYRSVEIAKHLQYEAVGLYGCYKGLDKRPRNNRRDIADLRNLPHFE